MVFSGWRFSQEGPDGSAGALQRPRFSLELLIYRMIALTWSAESIGSPSRRLRAIRGERSG